MSHYQQSHTPTPGVQLILVVCTFSGTPTTSYFLFVCCFLNTYIIYCIHVLFCLFLFQSILKFGIWLKTMQLVLNRKLKLELLRFDLLCWNHWMPPIFCSFRERERHCCTITFCMYEVMYIQYARYHVSNYIQTYIYNNWNDCQFWSRILCKATG